MDVKLDKWHKCKVDIEVLKELSKKSDIKGLQHVSLFFGLLVVTGSLAYLTWGTWWSVFWFANYNWNFSLLNLGNMVVDVLVFSLWKHLWFFKSIMA